MSAATGGARDAMVAGPRVVMTFPFSLGMPGGAPLDCVLTARHMREAGAEVTVLPVFTDTQSWFPRPRPRGAAANGARGDDLRRKGVEVLRVSPHPASYLLDGLPTRRAAERLLGLGRVDVLVGWYQEAAFLAPLLRERGVLFGMIAAASYTRHANRRSHWPRWVNRRVDDRFIAQPLREADVVFARSAFTAGEVVRLFGVSAERVRVVHCGVDAGLAQIPRLPAPGLERLLYFGQLNRSKGIFDALEALAVVARSGRRGWTLRIAGGGETDAVRRKARRLGLGDRVELLGPLSYDALKRQLEWAQLAVLPSRAESFGLAIAEAQASALPVAAYAAAAVPEIVEGGVTGWLAPVGRVDLLAEAIEEAMADPPAARERGLSGRRRALERFSWQRTAAETLRGLDEAMNRRKTA